MIFSKSQYSVNNKTYAFERTEANGKITGRFTVPQFGVLPFKAIYLEYRAGQEEGGKRSFRMNLWDGNIFKAEHVKTEKGTISRYDGKVNRDYEEKVKSMVREAIELSESE